jgi:hypothetical protein
VSIFTVLFWKAAAERALKSAAQGAILAGVGVAKFDALHASWETIGGAALGAAVLSVLTSVASDALTDGAGPSLTDAEVLPRSPVDPAAPSKYGSQGSDGWQGPVD